MLFKSALTAALAGSVLAIEGHQHHEHQGKRDVKVVTQVNVVEVTVAGNQVVPNSVTQPALSTLSTVTTSAATTVDAANTDAASTAAAAASTASSTAATTGSTSVGSGGAKGITYSPYSDDGGCKSSSDIASEIAKLSGFNIIRLYGVDCDQVSAVLASKTSSQKIFAGIYDMTAISDGVSTLAAAVKSSGSWDDIYTVSIGNELVNNGEATTSQIQSYVESGRSALTAAGYSGPVVSVDTFIATINNPALCDYSDYVAVNAHAFFDGGIAAAGAGAWVLEQIELVSTACGGKDVLIVESGWPSSCTSNGKASCSSELQAAAISSIKSSCGNDVFLFNAYNDLWKADGSYNCEKYWGIFSS
ncbi:cell surface mannoprotein Mp65p [[Candida] railenensis]|uniref:Cell surface mannoprotein Mp65p n=1 Tax=[Candida] railenensis TaxID=45579 RepID=A0A9P0QTQ0_9ASCO|nr:cell surface mannoprotein Mp65p [[Candida] railenensis]